MKAYEPKPRWWSEHTDLYRGYALLVVSAFHALKRCEVWSDHAEWSWEVVETFTTLALAMVDERGTRNFGSLGPSVIVPMHEEAGTRIRALRKAGQTSPVKRQVYVFLRAVELQQQFGETLDLCPSYAHDAEIVWAEIKRMRRLAVRTFDLDEHQYAQMDDSDKFYTQAKANIARLRKTAPKAEPRRSHRLWVIAVDAVLEWSDVLQEETVWSEEAEDGYLNVREYLKMARRHHNGWDDDAITTMERVERAALQANAAMTRLRRMRRTR